MAKSKVVINTSQDVNIVGGDGLKVAKAEKKDYHKLCMICLLMCAFVLVVILYLDLRIVYPYCFRSRTSDSSIIIAALTILTSVLIGFQIWNIIKFDDRIERVKKEAADEIERKSELSSNSSAGISMATLGAFYGEEGGKLKFATWATLQAMVLLDRGDKEQPLADASWVSCVDNMLNIIQRHTAGVEHFHIELPREVISEMSSSYLKSKTRRREI